MAEEIEELLVRAKPEGLDETSQGFNQMQSDLEDAEGQMGDTTDQFEELSQKWRGAMGALVGGLAVATAGVLAQVPILGEAMEGLNSIAGAVGYQIDQLARDLGAGGLVDAAYNASDAIYSLDGAAGDLFAGVSVVLGAITTYAAAVGLMAAKTGGAAAGLSAFTGVFTSIGGAISTAATAIVGFLGLWGLLAAAVAAFAVAYIFNLGGVRDKTDAILADIWSAFQYYGQKAADAFANTYLKAKKAAGRLGDTAGDMAGRVYGAIQGLVDDAGQMGSDLIDEFVQGIMSGIGDVEDAIGDVAETVDSYMPGSPADTGPLSDLDESGPGMVDTFASGISGSIGVAANASEDLAGASDPSSHSARRSRSPAVFLDGRRVDEQQGRHRADNTHRRGI